MKKASMGRNPSTHLIPVRKMAKRIKPVVTKVFGGSRSQKMPKGTNNASEDRGKMEIRMLIRR